MNDADIFVDSGPDGVQRTDLISTPDGTEWATTLHRASYFAGPVMMPRFTMLNTTFWSGPLWSRSPPIAMQAVADRQALFGPVVNSAGEVVDGVTGGDDDSGVGVGALVAIIAVAAVAGLLVTGACLWAFMWRRRRGSSSEQSSDKGDGSVKGLRGAPVKELESSSKASPVASARDNGGVAPLRIVSPPPLPAFPVAASVSTGDDGARASQHSGATLPSAALSVNRVASDVSARSGRVRQVQAAVLDAVKTMQAQMQAELHDRHLQLRSEIGRGGFGTVYHGAHLTVQAVCRLCRSMRGGRGPITDG